MKMDSSDDCNNIVNVLNATALLYLIMMKMVSFMLYTFYHNKRNAKKPNNFKTCSLSQWFQNPRLDVYVLEGSGLLFVNVNFIYIIDK